MTGHVMSLAAETHDTVAHLKTRIQDAEGIPPECQRLILAGRRLEDEQTLAHYRVSGQHTLLLHLLLSEPANDASADSTVPLSLNVKTLRGMTISCQVRLARAAAATPADWAAAGCCNAVGHVPQHDQARRLALH